MCMYDYLRRASQVDLHPILFLIEQQRHVRVSGFYIVSLPKNSSPATMGDEFVFVSRI